MDENKLPRWIIECKWEGARIRGPQKLRRTNGMGESLSKLGIKGW